MVCPFNPIQSNPPFNLTPIHLVGPAVWAGLMLPVLMLAALTTPLYALYTWSRYRKLRRACKNCVAGH